MNKKTVSGSILGIIFAVCFLVPLFFSSDLEQFKNSQLISGPSFINIFGTDLLGRDFFLRTAFGGRMTLTISLFTAIFSLFLASSLVYLKTLNPRLELLIAPILNLFYAVPTLLILIFISLLFKEKETGIVLALSLEGIFISYQVLSSDVIRLEAKSFVHASILMGTPKTQIFFKHYFPHLIASLKSLFLLLVPLNILNESFLGFLGLGIMPPQTSWGCLLNEGWKGYLTYPHLIFFPGLFLFLTMLAFYWMRDLNIKTYE